MRRARPLRRSSARQPEAPTTLSTIGRSASARSSRVWPRLQARRGRSRYRPGCRVSSCRTWREWWRCGSHCRTRRRAQSSGGSRRIRRSAKGSRRRCGTRHESMTEVDLFQAHRSRLFGVAYRMLGSASDAEDVVQDAWLRYSNARPADLRSPAAYLTTIVTRLCLDRLKSARTAREEYVGPWLPEPLVTDEAPGPERSVALAESVTLAFMVLLETLSPEERAVFLLREVFDHEYDEIAGMLDTTPANCRQLFHRAKTHLADRRPRFRDAAGEKRPLVSRFVAALRAGDADELMSVLAEDVGFWSDGGGKVLAARRPVFGREQVALMLAGFK